MLSFTRLAARAAEEAGGSAREYVDAGGRLLRLALALDQVGGSLEVYGPARRQPESMGQLLTALDELRGSRGRPGRICAGSQPCRRRPGSQAEGLALNQEARTPGSPSGSDPASRMDI